MLLKTNKQAPSTIQTSTNLHLNDHCVPFVSVAIKTTFNTINLAIIKLMLPTDTLFNQSSFFQKYPQNEDDGSLYTPWAQETKNYKFASISYERRKKPNTNRRYTSQIESYHSCKSRNTKESPPKKLSILTQKSVTIEFDEEKAPSFSPEELPMLNKIKFPVITTKRLSKQPSKNNLKKPEQNWQVLQSNKQNSLKKYVPKLHADSPPHFQIYKRSLIAARKSILNSLSNTQAINDLYKKN